MKDSSMIRVDPEFTKLVDEIAEQIADDLGIKNKSTTNRKISRKLVTRYMAKQYKKKKGFEL